MISVKIADIKPLSETYAATVMADAHMLKSQFQPRKV
jgi:hypothetical protein